MTGILATAAPLKGGAVQMIAMYVVLIGIMWFYPDTYSYTPDSTDLDLLKRASTRLQKALAEAWSRVLEALALGLFSFKVRKLSGHRGPRVGPLFLARTPSTSRLH